MGGPILSEEDDGLLIAAWLLNRLVEKAAHRGVAAANTKAAAAKRKIIFGIVELVCMKKKGMKEVVRGEKVDLLLRHVLIPAAVRFSSSTMVGVTLTYFLLFFKIRVCVRRFFAN